MGPRMAHIYELFFPEWNPDDLNTVQHTGHFLAQAAFLEATFHNSHPKLQ